MNKREQAEHEALKTRLALRFTDGEFAPDIPPPPAFGDVTRGYTLSLHYREAVPACSSHSTHGLGKETESIRRGGLALYSSEVLALRALRQQLEAQFAGQLREVDKKIEAALAKSEPATGA